MATFSQPFREVDAVDIDSFSLKEEMDLHGYVLVRGLLPVGDLARLLGEAAEVLSEAEWIDARDPVGRLAKADAACGEDDASYKEVYDRVFGLQRFHALPHHVALQGVMRRLVGPQLLVHPKAAARLIFPKFDKGVIHAHQDHTAVAGDAECYTAWIPLHDCPVEEGALRVLEGSHRFGVQETVGRTGYIAPGSERGEAWVSGDLYAGDVLIFHSLTVHEAAPNISERMRVSLDCRFQSYARSVNPAALVFTGNGRRSWEKTYAGWATEEWKYYWRHLPLEFSPSKLELAELAQRVETPEMRERYARILERLEEEGVSA